MIVTMKQKNFLNMHYDEIALNKDLLKLNPSIEQYEVAEKMEY